MNEIDDIRIRPIGHIRSPLKSDAQAPRQGREAAVQGELVVHERYLEAFNGLMSGQRIVILYWMHKADRDKLQVHPRGDRTRPLRGVFATRSPHRPNPIAMDEVEILGITGATLSVKGLDAIDGTPLLDIKCEF